MDMKFRGQDWRRRNHGSIIVCPDPGKCDYNRACWYVDPSSW